MLKNLKYLFFGLVLTSLILASCSTTAVQPQPVATQAPATVAAATEAPVTQAPAAQQNITLRVWWWGEQEAPGLEKWLKESADLYKKDHPNISIEFTLLENTTMYPNFLAAEAAGNPPDIQVLWGGVLGLEQAWNGNIQSLSQYFSEDELKHVYCTTRAEGYWEGTQYLVPLYLDAWLFAYNKDVFKKAGLDPEKPPTTWDEFEADLEKIKTAGDIPFSIGMKDGAFGSWIPSLLGTSMYDSISELHKAVIGEESFTDKKHAYWWTLWKDLLDKKLVNDDASSITGGEALDKFLQGNVGIVMNVQPGITAYARKMGVDKVGVFTSPKYGNGKLAGLLPIPGTDLAIPTKAAHPKEAADFIRFLYTPERVNAEYNISGAIPASDQIDQSIITLPTDQLIVKWVHEKPGPTYNYNYPGDFESALYVIGQDFVAGNLTPEQAAQKYQDAAQKWRDQNPEGVKNFQKWIANPLACPYPQ